MKKILLAFDNGHYSEGAFECARLLHEAKPILLVGAFLPQVDYSGMLGYPGGGMAGPVYVPVMETVDREAMQLNMERFEAACLRQGIEFRIHQDLSEFALPGLKKESRYADLLIIGSETFYENLGTEHVNEYLKDTLKAVECPVLLVPEEMERPRQVILTYDGSESSMYAIRQFACLMPEWLALPSLLLFVDQEGRGEIPDQDSIQEWAARHFSDLTFLTLDRPGEEGFRDWLNDHPGALLVSGAYGRSSLSQLFHKSFMSDIIREHRLPVFNAHF